VKCEFFIGLKINNMEQTRINAISSFKKLISFYPKQHFWKNISGISSIKQQDML